MTATLSDRSGSREDRMWESALQQLTAEGVVGGEQAAAVLERHHSVEQVERERSRKVAVIELAGYLGAALTVGGVAAITSQVWGDFSEFAQVLVLAVLAAGMLVAAALTAGTAPGGAAGLASPNQAARRRLVGVLGILGAGLTTATLAVAFDQYLTAAVAGNWFWTAALAGLLIAALVSRFAPGVVPTLGVCGFLVATVLQGLDAIGWLQQEWASGLAIMGVAAFTSLVLVRWLTPVVLVEAAAVVGWLGAAIPMLGADPGYGITSSEATTMLWIGRIGILALIGIGAWKFARGGGWPWAIGVAGGAAAFVGFTFADALGGAIGMTLAGIALIVVAVLMLRAHPGGHEDRAA